MAAEIRLSADDRAAPWGSDLQRQAGEALAAAQARLGLNLSRPVIVRSYRDLEALQRDLGFDPEHIAAAAVPSRGLIAIVRPVWRASPPDEQRRTLLHEMTHLILGERAPRGLPAWLNEGIAMSVAGESTGAESWRLTLNGSFGSLVRLGDLEESVLLGGDRQALAYAESLSVTRFLLDRSYGGEVRALAAQLADPGLGPRLVAQLREPVFRQALEIQWRRRFEAVWSWISIFSGAGFIWGIVVLLFLGAVWRKRRMTRMIRERFDADEWSPEDEEAPLGPEPWVESELEGFDEPEEEEWKR